MTCLGLLDVEVENLLSFFVASAESYRIYMYNNGVHHKDLVKWENRAPKD